MSKLGFPWGLSFLVVKYVLGFSAVTYGSPLSLYSWEGNRDTYLEVLTPNVYQVPRL